MSDAYMVLQGKIIYPESEAAVGAVGERLEGLLLGGRAVKRAEACGIGPLDDHNIGKT